MEARKLFLAAAPGASLEAIAQAAGVGIGTLYRHFPTREALVEAVYRSELDALDLQADQLLASRPTAVAMREWMNSYAQFVATKHAMHDALRIALTSRSETRERIGATITRFLDAHDGTLRTDVLPDDVTLSLAGVVFAATRSADPEQLGRLLDLLMAGLRPPG